LPIYQYRHIDKDSDKAKCLWCVQDFDSPEYGLLSCPDCGYDVRRVWGLAGFSIK
jgi:hypothetical protein